MDRSKGVGEEKEETESVHCLHKHTEHPHLPVHCLHKHTEHPHL